MGTHNPWDQGPLSIDEGINVMQSACTGNSSTMGFVMLPQYHSSTSKAVVLKNRRLLEDKLVGCLDTFRGFHALLLIQGMGEIAGRSLNSVSFIVVQCPCIFPSFFPGIENSKLSTGI